MNHPFGIPPFDPSKMDPKVLMKLSQLIMRLPPAQMQRLQSLMHNMMAGFNVTKELEEFEKELPPGFRQDLVAILSEQAQLDSAKAPEPAPSESPSGPLSMRDARLTILRAVAEGRLSPEEAESLLFK